MAVKKETTIYKIIFNFGRVARAVLKSKKSLTVTDSEDSTESKREQKNSKGKVDLRCRGGNIVLDFFVYLHYQINPKMTKKVKAMIELIEEDGWFMVAQKGSHRQFKHQKKKGKVTINGKLSDDLGDFLIKSITKQAGI